MSRGKAFSLRDLVAILCLAGLALPILGASVGGVISQSAAVRCRTNLAALTRAILVHAERNRGYMPVYQDVYTDGYIRAPDNTYKAAVCFHQAGYTGPIDVLGLGRIYTQGLARPAELFYCPSQRDTRHTLGYYPKPWGSAVNPDHTTQHIRNGYMWNPWVKRIPGGQSNQWTYEDGLALARHPRERFLTCDLVMRAGNISHRLPDSAEWNLAYPDGHVAPFASPELYDVFVSQGFDANQDWTLFNSGVRPYLPGASAGPGP